MTRLGLLVPKVIRHHVARGFFGPLTLATSTYSMTVSHRHFGTYCRHLVYCTVLSKITTVGDRKVTIHIIPGRCFEQ
jgi:hypothetical protein